MPKRFEEKHDEGYDERRDERRVRREGRNGDTFYEEPTRKQTQDFKQPPKSRVEVHQPTTEVWDYENHWQNDFIDCCNSYSMCACAFFCTPCFMSKLFSRTGECCCMCVIPGSLMSLRAKLRTGFRIKGSICKDCCATTFCPLCVAIQMTQELDKQEL